GNAGSGSTEGGRSPPAPCGRAPPPGRGPWRTRSASAGRRGPPCQGEGRGARGPRHRAATAAREAGRDGRCVPCVAHYPWGLTIRSVVGPAVVDQPEARGRPPGPHPAPSGNGSTPAATED